MAGRKIWHALVVMIQNSTLKIADVQDARRQQRRQRHCQHCRSSLEGCTDPLEQSDK
jgi:hypothetical protein